MKKEHYGERIEDGIRVQEWPEDRLRQRVREMGGNADLEAWIVALVRGLADWESISEASNAEVAKLRARISQLEARRSA